MRARNREINIFNMSLLDILCGALGAFCFMMLVLLPYYKPPGTEAELHEQQREVDELVKNLDAIKQKLKDAELAKEMSEVVRRLEEQIKGLEGQMNRIASENAQLSAQNKQLTGQNAELSGRNEQLTQENRQLGEKARQLDQRTPFLVLSGARMPGQEVDLYLHDNLVSGDRKSPAFDPEKKRQGQFWGGDIYGWITGRGVAMWVVRDSPVGVKYKIYVKLANDPTRSAATAVFGTVFGGTYTLQLPDVALSPERPWALVGTLTGEAGGKVSFKEATAAEREAEWAALAKSTPPAAAAASPSPKASPTAAAGASPTAAPTARSLDDERRRMIEKLRKEQEEREKRRSESAGGEPEPEPDPRALERDRLEKERRARQSTTP